MSYFHQHDQLNRSFVDIAMRAYESITVMANGNIDTAETKTLSVSHVQIIQFSHKPEIPHAQICVRVAFFFLFSQNHENFEHSSIWSKKKKFCHLVPLNSYNWDYHLGKSLKSQQQNSTFLLNVSILKRSIGLLTQICDQRTGSFLS